MNFLAHSYLSFHHHEILIGNMISDFVKGKKKFDYPKNVQAGIALHRSIDNFTDNHTATKEAAKFLKPAVGLYAGAFIDVAFDHFLANDGSEFTNDSLQAHASDTYGILTKNFTALPQRVQMLLPYMQSQNWLYNYKNIAGAQSSFGGVAKRARYLDSSAEVFGLFQTHYNSLHDCYKTFFPSLKEYSLLQFKQLLNN